ncbi:DUF131 domain-containing protein [Candidatus Bathyarchaeota archaeon]|nr:DUF131 domain-containing protein [Candidatus Bathyarchaeota archaeon]
MAEIMVDFTAIFFIGLALVILGFAISIFAILMMVLRGLYTRSGGGIRGGGLIMIGPIPILFGTDRKTVKTLIILSIVLIIVVMTFTLLLASLPPIR